MQQKIYQREKTEEALHKSQQRLASILELAQDAIILINYQQEITVFNQGASQMFGYSPLELMGQSLNILLPESMRKIHYHHVNNYVKDIDQIHPMNGFREITALRKDGTEFKAEASISKIEVDNDLILTVILRDITERKQAK